MMTPCHMIFAPTGTLKIRSADYHRVHADLRLTARKAERERGTKHQRMTKRIKVYKQTSELNP